jgi:hypothetical protein
VCVVCVCVCPYVCGRCRGGSCEYMSLCLLYGCGVYGLSVCIYGCVPVCVDIGI